MKAKNPIPLNFIIANEDKNIIENATDEIMAIFQKYSLNMYQINLLLDCIIKAELQEMKPIY